MKRKIAFAALAGTLLISNMSVFAEEYKKETMFSEGVNQLASDIYGEMETEENVFFSPYSISVALSMLNLEADGETKAQIEDMLGIEDMDEWNKQVSEYIKKNDREGAVVETANGMWISEELELSKDAQKEVLDPLKEFFEGEVTQADMKKDREKILEEINGWVSDHTDGMIDPFLEELPNGTASMLINAVYFDGKWSMPFDEERTEKSTFYGSEKEAEIDMMAQEGTFFYLENEEYQAIQLPYGDGSVVMNIVLPKDTDKPIEQWYKDLGKDQTEIWQELNEAETADMKVVKIPKFALECSIPDLDNIMKELGMTDAYSEEADFSRLAENIQVDSMLHKAKLEVSEQYTKASAATGIISKMTAIIEEEEKPEFVADHPFMFTIQDKENDMILFMGHVNQL